MKWTVTFSNKAAKQTKKLSEDLQAVVDLLRTELENEGPYQIEWPNYSPLKNNHFHCHLKRGRPTFVAVWFLVDKRAKTIEVTYVGTHENAPY